MKSPLAALLLASIAVALVGCGVPPAATPTNPVPAAGGGIHWPKRYEPNDAGFFVHNAIDVDAPPRVVWELLVQAEQWPRWYEGATDVRVLGAVAGVLDASSSFSWSTMGLDFTSTIKEFVPNERLSWESRKSTIQGYHAWLITPTPTGCRVVTEESQHGLLTTVQKIFVPRKLHRLHDRWLAELKRLAEARSTATTATAGTAASARADL